MIIGIVLIKNEDRFIEQVLKNILDFCDSIIVTDNGSTDNTVNIVKRMATQHAKITLKHVQHPRESHEVLEPYAGKDVWVFGVDGDELYDPKGLQELKQKILTGNYQDYWCIYGNVLNCTALDEKSLSATGYLAPPSRSMTKLYNFSLLQSWEGCPERLHGGIKRFKNSAENHNNLELFRSLEWDNSFFRCLHMAFIPRSTKYDTILLKGKLNPAEIEAIDSARRNKEWGKLLKRLYQKAFGSKWKNKKYRRGPIVEKNVNIFFNT